MGMDLKGLYSDILVAIGCTRSFATELANVFVDAVKDSKAETPSIHEFKVLALMVLKRAGGLSAKDVAMAVVKEWLSTPSMRTVPPRMLQGYPILTINTTERVVEIYCQAKVGNQVIASPKYTIPWGSPEEVTTKAADMAVDDVCRELSSRGINFNMKGASDA